MFDLLGRVAIGGLWSYGEALRCTENDDVRRSLLFAEATGAAAAVKALISNNPALYSPHKG